MEKFVIGIDLGGTNIRGAIVNEKGKFLTQWSESTPAQEGRAAVIDKICSVTDHLIKKNKDILGIGIGTPGIIDQKTGDIIGASPNIVDWPGTPLGSILAERYHLPIQVDNDVNAISMGEFYFGNHQSGKDLACIALGTGVGVGIILNGEIFAKAHELGHMVVNFEGALCSCGRQGCVEASTSGKSLVKRYLSQLGQQSFDGQNDFTAKQVFDKYQEGCMSADKVIAEFIAALASAMVNILLAFSITNFIMTGGVAQNFLLFHDRLLIEIRRRSISHLNDKIVIKRGTLNDGAAGILGAASLVFKKEILVK